MTGHVVPRGVSGEVHEAAERSSALRMFAILPNELSGAKSPRPPRRGTCRAGEEAELVKFVTEFLQEVLPRPCQPSTQADPHAADSALSCQAPDRAIASSPAGRTPKRF